jgi:transcriptional regulator with GAF, ATPase, and Fis domain
MSGVSLIKPNNFRKARKIAAIDSGKDDLNNQVEALKVLANLLLQEIESFEQTSPLNMERREIDLIEEVEKFEANLIRRALVLSRGKQCEAARMLKIKNTTLNAKIKRYGIKFCKTEFIEEISSTN